MLILSIDCAGSGCGVCVWQDGNIRSEITERMERGQDQRLLPMVMQAMQQANVKFDDLDRIAVTRGPGSFTGLRIGLAAARGIGLASEKPVIGIDRFSIFHEQFKTTSQNIFVVINSRRAELYARYYPATGNAADPVMMTEEEIVDFLKNNPGTLAVGDTRTFCASKEPEHITCAARAARADISNTDFLPRPLYLRPPDVTLPVEKISEPKIRQTIRSITNADANTLAHLHAESFGAAKWGLQQIESSLSLTTTKGWGIFENNEMFGFLICQLIPHQSEVLTFCVSPSHRRKGAGARLLQTAASAAHGKGSHLYLETAADNLPAITLYKKLGFESSGRRPGYYKTGQTSVDALLFTLLTKTA
jgi:tRNA threonylcarbamoyladenosine biosynthesis protein TsaB